MVDLITYIWPIPALMVAGWSVLHIINSGKRGSGV